MEITIDEAGRSNAQIVAHFTTAFGSARGIWKGTEVPQIGHKYDVEFEIPSTLFWGRDIHLAENTGYSIAEQDGGVVLNGTVELIGDDDTLTVRIGDSLILLEAQDCPANISGMFIKIRTPFPFLYDTRL